MLSWFFLLLAGIAEVAWAVGLKYSMGFTRLVPSVLTIIGMVVSVVLLAMALRTLPLGTAYAAWTGIGAVGTVIMGVVLFGDPMTAARICCLALIITGIAGLKLLTK